MEGDGFAGWKDFLEEAARTATQTNARRGFSCGGGGWCDDVSFFLFCARKAQNKRSFFLFFLLGFLAGHYDGAGCGEGERERERRSFGAFDAWGRTTCAPTFF